MNIFSNIGITELIFILLLALLVVGPERLPELGKKLGQLLRDVRRAYDNLARDLGPELAELQKSTLELRESVESVRSIPQDVVKTVVEATDLEDTMADLKEVTGTLDDVGQTLSAAGQTIKDPVGAAADAARKTLDPRQTEETAASAEESPAEEQAVSEGDAAEDSAEEAASSKAEPEAAAAAEAVQESAPDADENQIEAAVDD